MKTEQHTRKEIIDKQLLAAGWNVSDRSQVVEEFDIEVGLPEGVSEPLTPYQGHQFSDYVLLGKDAKPLAVYESFRHERRMLTKGRGMKRKLTKEQQEEIRALQEMPDEEIDYSDIPPVTDWGKAVVGRFYRPVKETVTVRLDADVLDWLKQGGKGYQTRMNKILRAVMEQQRKKAV